MNYFEIIDKLNKYSMKFLISNETMNMCYDAIDFIDKLHSENLHLRNCLDRIKNVFTENTKTTNEDKIYDLQLEIK